MAPETTGEKCKAGRSGWVMRPPPPPPPPSRLSPPFFALRPPPRRLSLAAFALSPFAFVLSPPSPLRGLRLVASPSQPPPQPRGLCPPTPVLPPPPPPASRPPPSPPPTSRPPPSPSHLPPVSFIYLSRTRMKANLEIFSSKRLCSFEFR
ncbi:hypothetical protein NL676_031056 [Syzygium grande]|nr:hypothetical protein NL676_031056 [Syzygium grande]